MRTLLVIFATAIFALSSTAFAGKTAKKEQRKPSGNEMASDDMSQVQIPVLGLPQEGQFGIPAADTDKLQAEVQKAAEKYLKVGNRHFTRFKVDWSPAGGFKCIGAMDEQDPEANMGVCKVSFSGNANANGVRGSASITRDMQGKYTVTIILADIE